MEYTNVSISEAIEAAQRSDTLVYSIYFASNEGFQGFGRGGGVGRGGGMGRGGGRRPQEERPDGNLGGRGAKLDFSAVAKYASAEEAVLDPAVEAVDICLPTHLHERIAVLALAAGKHVLVEKPMALDGAAADRMIAAAERHGRVLMAAQVVRFIPPYRAAADILRSGRLGAVRAAIFRRRCAAPAWSAWLTDPAQSGGGVFDLLIHD